MLAVDLQFAAICTNVVGSGCEEILQPNMMYSVTLPKIKKVVSELVS
jgi:hypothetical protein